MDFLLIENTNANGIKREFKRLKWYNKRLKKIEEKMDSLNKANNDANRYDQMINNQMIKQLIERQKEINIYAKYYEEILLVENNLTA